MTTVNRNAIVPYSAAQMYALVDDIARYPEFLPWCAEAREISRTPDEVQATLTLQWKGFSKNFTTRNLLQPHKMMEIRLVDGPFKHLEGFWQFTPLGDQGSKVQLALEFEFSNHFISLAFSKVFEQISLQLVQAFCTRAVDVYGK
jgi:ribosome-associated toxin RatA of RatAB toxin-antitoxin module